MDKEIYIIRHGETELNRQGIVQGRGVNTDLNETGRMQAAAFYEKYKNIPFQKIYTSTLKRTHQTVKRFIDAGVPSEALSGLDELAWGLWEGKPNDETVIAAFREIMERWQDGDYDAMFEGGESPNMVQFRQKQAMKLIMSRKEEKLILICMHGRAMRLLLCLLMNKPLSEMGDFPHQNTALYRIACTDGSFSIIDFNNTDHLK